MVYFCSLGISSVRWCHILLECWDWIFYLMPKHFLDNLRQNGSLRTHSDIPVTGNQSSGKLFGFGVKFAVPSECQHMTVFEEMWAPK